MGNNFFSTIFHHLKMIGQVNQFFRHIELKNLSIISGRAVTTCAQVSHIKNATILGSIEEVTSEEEVTHTTVDEGSLDLGIGRNNKGDRFLSVCQTTRRPPDMDFLETEELGTIIPKRCMRCVECKDCSLRSQDMSRRVQEELRLIESGMSLD